ncbi:MAG: heat-inducible transcriptional repressor HrcA [Desulfonatronovibrionaceae bacterium]
MPRADYLDREKKILETVIREYIRTGRPVGSRTVARAPGINLSAATVRNVMSDLESRELLTQPHTSAGRVPTVAGMRFYLNSLLTLEKLDQRQKELIKRSLMESGPDFKATLRRASRVLSSFSNQIAMVMSPAEKAAVWKQIDFVLLKPGLVMSVLVLEGGLVSNRVIETGKKLTADDLIRYSNYLNDNFQGRTVAGIRQSIIRQLHSTKQRLKDLYQQALSLAYDACEEAPERELYVGGATNALDQENPDFSQLKDLLELLEEKSSLLNLLDKTVKASDLRVFFPQDHGLSNLSNYSLISSPYGPGENVLGTVGVVGPVHMNYPLLIPTVDLVAEILTQLFQNNS